MACARLTIPFQIVHLAGDLSVAQKDAMFRFLYHGSDDAMIKQLHGVLDGKGIVRRRPKPKLDNMVWLSLPYHPALGTAVFKRNFSRINHDLLLRRTYSDAFEASPPTIATAWSMRGARRSFSLLGPVGPRLEVGDGGG